jgi:hypothetical protein
MIGGFAGLFTLFTLISPSQVASVKMKMLMLEDSVPINVNSRYTENVSLVESDMSQHGQVGPILRPASHGHQRGERYFRVGLTI